MALTTNLVAYYKLDESSGNPADATGNGYTLTNINTATFSAGLINNGIDCGNDGTTRGASISNNLGTTANGAKSISFWVKMNSEPSSQFNYIVQLNHTTTSTSFSIDYDDSGGTKHIRLEKYCSGNSDDVQVTYNVTLGTSTWHHIVGTTDGTTLTLYLDGVSVNTGSDFTASGSGSYTDVFQIGNSNTSHFKVDEVGVWNRALSSTEVSQLYNSGAGLQYPFSNSWTQTLTETITDTDSLIKSTVRTISETITNTPTFLSIHTWTKTITDTIVHSDTFAYLKTKGATLTEIISHLDTIFRNSTRVLLETVTGTDTFAYLKAKFFEYDETITIVSTFIRQEIKVFIETVTNTITFVSLRSAFGTFTEIITDTDTFAGLSIRVREMTLEVVTITANIMTLLNGIVTNLWSKVSRGTDNDNDWNRSSISGNDTDWTKTPQN